MIWTVGVLEVMSALLGYLLNLAKATSVRNTDSDFVLEKKVREINSKQNSTTNHSSAFYLGASPTLHLKTNPSSNIKAKIDRTSHRLTSTSLHHGPGESGEHSEYRDPHVQNSDFIPHLIPFCPYRLFTCSFPPSELGTTARKGI
jgi:hypothetical protein